MKQIFTIILTILLSSLSFAEVIQCKVVDVNDGNTIICLANEKQPIKVKLWGIDAPESDQAYNQKAKQALSEMALDRYITVIVEHNDHSNDLIVGTIFKWYSDLSIGHGVSAGNCLHSLYASEEEINKKDNTCGPWPMVIVNINHEMIKKGMAWSTPSTEKNSEYQQAEQDAREAKLGLWSQPNPVSP